MNLKKIFYILFLVFCVQIVRAQADNQSSGSTIEILYADYTERDENTLPGALVLTGNVQALHDSIYIYCNKAYFFQADNYLKLFGNVRMIQNDTLQMNSKYAEYNGKDQIAYASGSVVMRSPNSQLTSEKVYYDRQNGVAYYDEHANIVNRENTLVSKEGRYIIAEEKYEFRTHVVLTNPETKIITDHLDFYEAPGHAYLLGPSTIESEDSFIYTENGFHDTRLDQSKLLENSYILTDNKRIDGEDIYYDKNINYTRAINHVKVTDTINNMIATSHFAEIYQFPDGRDSVYITQKPLIKMLAEEDSTYFHAKEIFLTGRENERVMWGYTDARMFRDPDMSAKADSIHFQQKLGLTKLLGKPVAFKGESQITGEIMHLINDTITEKMDSIKVLKDAFLIQKDTLGTGFNQAKGINLYGKFIDDELKEVDLIQNAEMIYYIYDEDDLLTGIDKGIASQIRLELEDNQITTATRMVSPKGETYPPDEFPENARLFPGFNWRGDERIMRPEDIFPESENLQEDKLLEELNQQLEEQSEIKLQQETIDYQLNKKEKPVNKIQNES